SDVCRSDLTPGLPLFDIPVDVHALGRTDPPLGGLVEAHRLRVWWPIERCPVQSTIVRDDERGTIAWDQPAMQRLRLAAPGNPPALRRTREMDRPDRRVGFAQLAPRTSAVGRAEQGASRDRPAGRGADEVHADELLGRGILPPPVRAVDGGKDRVRPNCPTEAWADHLDGGQGWHKAGIDAERGRGRARRGGR